MMHMPDPLRATIELMEAPAEKYRCAHPITYQNGVFSPKEIYAEIKKHVPGFRSVISRITGSPLPTAGRKHRRFRCPGRLGLEGEYRSCQMTGYAGQPEGLMMNKEQE